MAKKEKINSKTILLFVLSTLTLMASGVHADTRQSFGPLQFQVPNDWSCQTDADNYICLSPGDEVTPASALVVSYKLKSAQDSLEIYQDQLNRPRQIQNNEVLLNSVPKGVRRLTLGQHVWVEGIQLGSEVQNYYTHYYATTTSANAILASISIPERKYEAQKALINKIVQSFQIREGEGSQPGGNLSGATDNTRISSGKKLTSANSIVFMGKRWPKMYLLIGLGLIVTLALLAYAVMLE